MANHEEYYSSSLPSSASYPANPTSTSATPPPPPPKAVVPSLSQEQSRSGSPIVTGPPPPPLPPEAHSTDSPRPQPPLPTSSTLDQPLQPHQRPPPAPPIPPPTLEEQWLPAHPDLTTYSTTDLAAVLQNPNLLAALAHSHPSYASSAQSLESHLQQNLAQANQLKQLEAQLHALRHATSQLVLQHTSLQNTWRRKQSEMDDALSPWGPRAMYQRLVSSINEQEALVKAVVESFLEGSGGGGMGGTEDYYNGDGAGSAQGKASEKEVSEWIRRIREGATVLERRREMRGRWDEGRVGGWR